MKQNFFIVIYGPTGVGKTQLAEELSPHIPLEVINADVGQFYKPFSIGTAKPDWENSKLKHHLFDILNEPCDYTVVEYRKQVMQIMQEVWKRNRIPVIVGGSGFYIRSLFFPPKGDVASKIDFIESSSSKRKLWDELKNLDPLRASKIKVNDVYRVRRAIEICKESRENVSVASDFIPQFSPISNFIYIDVTRSREELYQLINDRTNEMLKNGWIDETRLICGSSWESFIKRKKLIGYNEILDFIKSKSSWF